MTDKYRRLPAESKCFWQVQAEASGLPVFPIRIDWDAGQRKWLKRPLTRHGHHDASRDASRFDWSHANGYGIPMGDGLYAFDVDAHKQDGGAARDWLATRGLRDAETRVHTTVSGGWHLIFRLPPEHRNLPSRSNIVPALDSRGAGGWIAFGQGYEVWDDSEPAPLRHAVCEEILAGHSGIAGTGPQSVALFDYRSPDGARTANRWEIAQASMRLLRHRAFGTKSTGDLSRSAADHSVAFCLAILGWSEHEIVYALLNLFEHGACRDPDKPEGVRLRAAMRCAAKGIVARNAAAASLRLNMNFTMTEADEAALLAQIGAK